MLLALAMLYPFVVLLGGVLLWEYISPYGLMGNYPHLFIVGTGLAFGFLVVICWFMRLVPCLNIVVLWTEIVLFYVN
nr:choline/ethanolaminephosphotransferase 1-like isoform X2 [Ipomoea batatas]